MKYISPIYLFSLLIFSACDNQPIINGVDDVTSVDITFKAKYGTEDFIANNVYDYNGDKIRISNLQFFVSELSLGTDGNGSEVDEVEFVDFSLITDATLAAEGLAIASSSSIPVGEYPGLNLGVGVVPDLNGQTPDQFSATHPLSKTNNYWADWDSYIFLKLEGTMDTNDDNVFDDVNFVYHVGSDPTFKQVNMSKGITLAKDEAMGLVVELDIEKLFVRDGVHLDIESNPKIHNINQLETGHYLMDNFVNALTIQ